MMAPSPAELGRDLRESPDAYLQRRRGILELSLFSSALLAGVALYQTGIIKNCRSRQGILLTQER